MNPGSVEAIQENPQNKEQVRLSFHIFIVIFIFMFVVMIFVDHINVLFKVLIGYKKGLMVLWDHQSCDLKQSFCSMQGLESLHFDCTGEKFVSSHADGSLTVWNLREDAEHKCESPCESPCPFGPFPCKAITKVSQKFYLCFLMCVCQVNLSQFSNFHPSNCYNSFEVLYFLRI